MMFKVGLRFGNVTLIVETREQWKALVDTFGDLTVDETLERIYVDHTTLLKCQIDGRRSSCFIS